MPTYTLEQLEERYRSLPEAVKDALVAVETSEAIIRIGKKYNLHIDQTGDLAEAVGLVMLGFAPYYQFVRRIQDQLGVDRQTAENIALDINAEIFQPIRGSLVLTTTPPEEELPSPEEVLSDIENPPPSIEVAPTPAVPAAEPAPPPPPLEAPPPAPQPAPPAETVFEEKLAKMFKLPKEEGKKEKDPYLEPIE